jgi:CubicO group peptidase (beta-lactamase class C family)
VPGAAIGVLRDGKTTAAYCGVADATVGEAVTPETLFSVGSLTKSMVATMLAHLAEAGRLSLDDPVIEYVPELRRSVWGQDVSIRDLLANRSGLPLSTGLEFDFAGRKDDADALSRLVGDIPSDRPAGTVWSYTNVGWCVLGRVIETVAGATWEDAMQRHFTDAGLRETSFTVGAVMKRRASGHEATADGPVPVEPLSGRAYGPAGTTAVSTVADLLRFAALHLEDPSLADLREVHADVAIHSWLDSWCLGWARFDWGGGRVWGWDGLVSGERSVLRLLPDRQAAVVLMTNSSAGRAMYRSLFADLMEPLFGIRVPSLRLDASPGAAADLARFAGVYAWPDHRVEVTAADSTLLIKSEDCEIEAFPLDERTIVVDPADPDNPTMTFGAFDANGRPRVLYDMLWGLPRLDE